MSRFVRNFAAPSLGSAALILSPITQAADPFAENVRTTDPLTPEQQQKTFQMPPGFEVQLVAAEPDINKPMNMAFDTLGRLWVTTSIEYPWPAPTNRPARDRLMTFEDFAPDGRARKVTEFAGGLNIPIGVYPRVLSDSTGKLRTSVIVWSIPNIWLMEDTDGDGKADKREVLFGPFDHTRDTHGNQSSFKRGFDGWLYATHGFNNDSHVKGRDGHEVHMNSGNTYRMRLDGSRLEHHTWGQVNPFGMAWDPAGNLYSADCHSSPTYQLLAGGYYPSFGKPHDGLGFAPVLMEHSHGSTAIDAMLYYADNLWPEEFHGNIFVGNVMTSRVNRDRLEYRGSSPKAIELDDFVKTTDPWFRPVDQQLGPDGAVYIADFYNRIIGHYEVPLTHPGRDRERGRIFRVVYKPKPLHSAAMPADVDGLIGELGSPNLTRRLLAENQLADQFGSGIAPRVTSELANALDGANEFKTVHLLWLHSRLGPNAALVKRAIEQRSPLIRTHAMRVLAEGLVPGNEFAESARRLLLNDADGLVRRCAAEALGARPAFENIAPLLSAVSKADAADTHLVYVLRKALRDQLLNDAVFTRVIESKWPDADFRALADVTVAVRTTSAGSFLLRNLSRIDGNTERVTSALQHAARYGPASELENVAQFARTRFANDLDFQLALFTGIEQGIAQSGATMSEGLRTWASELCTRSLTSSPDTGWWNTPVEGANDATNPWAFQERGCADGQKARLMSSHPRGENLMGVLRSRAFPLPAQLAFFLCGHDGEPSKPANKRNHVRLREATTGAVLAEAVPPRNDTAQKITWNLAAHQGKKGFVEFTDGDPSDAWAWLAFGRFEPAVLSLPALAPGDIARRQQTAAEIATRMRLPVSPQVREMALGAEFDVEARAAAARALAAIDRKEAPAALRPLLADASQSLRLREVVGAALIEIDDPTARSAVVEAMKSVPYRVQANWAQALAASVPGAAALIDAAEAGVAPVRLLVERAVKDRLASGKPAEIAARVTKLTENLPPVDRDRERLINQRRRAFAGARPNLADGAKVFQQTCAPCHQVDGNGGLVGPQLDGIGNRGLERVLEDVLDPNRNVDRAFRSHIISLKDGDIISGLPRREEGELLILADSTGKEISVPKKDIEARRESESSPMPENFGDIITPEDFNNLIGFLLSKNAQTK